MNGNCPSCWLPLLALIAVDAVALCFILRYLIRKHWQLFALWREVCSFWKQMGCLALVALILFANLFTIGHCLGESRLHYGTFCHFFDMVHQHAEMAGLPHGSAGAAALPAPQPADSPAPERGGDLLFAFACLCAFTGKFLLLGVFTAVFVKLVADLSTRLRLGLIHPVVQDGCSIILGYRDGMTLPLLKILLAESSRTQQIILLTARNIQNLKLELMAELPEGIWKRLKMVHGSWFEAADIRPLHIHRCSTLYLLGEDGVWNHDSLCIRTMDIIEKELAPHRRAGSHKVTCHILWEEMDFFRMVLNTSLAKREAEISYHPLVCNRHERLATNVLMGRRWDPKDDTTCPPLDRIFFLREPEKRVHFIILGMGAMGEEFAHSAILQAHYPNFSLNRESRTLITLIDPAAALGMQRMRDRYPRFFEKVRYEYRELADSGATEQFNSGSDLLDTELHFVRGDIGSTAVQDFLRASSESGRDVVTIAVCLGDSTANLKAAISLPHELRRRGIPVYVQQESRENLLQFAIDSRRSDRAKASTPTRYTPAEYSNLYPVGCIEDLFEHHAEEIRCARLFNTVHRYADEQVKAKLAMEATGGISPLQELDALCTDARMGASRHKLPPEPLAPCVLERATAIEGGEGTWTSFFAHFIALDNADEHGSNEDAEIDLAHLSIAQYWSNRYLVAAQETRCRQLPRPQGKGDEEQWKSILRWMDALQEMEHQRWMAERLLNADPLLPLHPRIAPLNSIESDRQYYRTFLSLTTYLIHELGAQ